MPRCWVSLGAVGAGSWLLCWSQVNQASPCASVSPLWGAVLRRFKNQSRCILGRKCSLEMRSCWQLDGHRVTVPVIRTPCPVPCCHLQAAGGGTAGGAEEGQPRQPGHRGQPKLFMETTRQPVRKGALLLQLGESQKPPSVGPDPARPASRKGLLSGAEQCHGSAGRAGAGAGPNPGCSRGFGCPSPGGTWGCLSCCAGGG